MDRLLALFILNQFGPYIDAATDEQVLGPTLAKREMQKAALAILQAAQAADTTFLPGVNLAAIAQDIT